ncbi:AFG1/ZapE family ATPase [Arthrobacter sp. ISL-65]|uniref:AFG1/ZapE family ATPase n=1 Tax=Arthrobacter sp. ISL-65 TaxID=2819112 RepID=UPI001BE53568|nr:AFG1/ZapE family ATPase [Arthrobacter sp. ISL-65]MBT2549991.1 cell division protein ZapE [Arthrobacter sp. ISL-65]
MAGFYRGLIITPGTERQLGAYGLFRPSPSQREALALPTGPLSVKGADPDILWVSFTELCVGGRSTADYLVLAERFPAWVVDGIPSLSGESTASPADWQRFLALLDVLHEREITPFLIAPGSHGDPFSAPQGSAADELAAVLSRIGERLSGLRRIESDEQLADEQSGGC